MEPLLLYFGKMILCSAVMFAYYLLFLKDKTFHHYNRFYLLLSVIISLVLPLIKVSYFTIETNKNLYLLLSQLNQNQLQTTTNYDITIYSVFYAVIGVVSIILLIKLIVGILRIQSIKKQFPNETIEGIKFYQTNLNNAPFSFFRNLFWKQTIQLDSPVGQQILKHEMVHIQQKHSWDKLLMQVTRSVFWFNPVFYFINKEINLIHEYLADKKAVKKSDTRAFAQMLLESHFSGSVIPVTSPFLSSNLKKRLTMLTKNQTKYSYARKLFALPILFFMVFAYMVNAKNKEIKETNKAIEIAVNELKNDTIKPKASEFDSLSMSHQKQTQLYSEALQEDHLKMSAISKKMAEKSKVLSALKKAKKEESSEYKALESDLENLSNQMQSIVDSDNYQKNLKGLEQHSEAMTKMYDSPEFKKRIADAEKSAKDAEAMVNSPEFKKRIADAEKQAKIAERMMKSPKFQKSLKNAQEQAEKMQIKINSPEFQKMIQDAQKKAQEASEQYGKIYSEADFQKMIKDQYGKDAFTDGTVAYGFDLSDFPEVKDLTTNFNFKFSDDNFFNEAKSKLSPKELKKMEKKRKQLQEKQKELMEEQKKLQEKQRELNKEMRQNNPWTISFNSNLDSPKALVYNKNITPPQRINRSNQVVVLDKSLDNTTVYINGKKVDRSELQKVEPSTISSMNVFKTNGTGKIEVTTK
ncbi:M56 family metallopeptidase [Epilithonimonas hungarica]|uniref:Signal transducer regulating beta-lactamase production, contains metallopeptidase domain n=1 Tax=Epilithonimonas hungarica TaxID=454006 RepID=A0A1G7M1K2_9FLAO|nr:M56 family metallopeptidase [Epilithonimonas hungarica]SDF55521.1 Signal transducer regulating beta-lactamase production, contains metallopeptidase domain [Epilithonimonas hungarica]